MKTRRQIGTVIYHIFMILFALLMLYPIIWMIMSSFKPSIDVMTKSYELIPSTWDFTNYYRGWVNGISNIPFSTFTWNSLYISVLATLGTIISASLAAYAFARCKFKLRGFWFACMLISMMMPIQVVMIPQYVMFQQFGWAQSALPLIVPAFFAASYGPFSIFLMMQFMQGIPKDLDEAATIDGCGKYSIFFRIIMPLIKPAIASAAIFAFYWKWDDFIGPLLYLNKPQNYTISMALRMMSDKDAITDWGVMFAMSTVSLIPTLIIFFCFQRYLVEGISTTGLKG